MKGFLLSDPASQRHIGDHLRRLRGLAEDESYETIFRTVVWVYKLDSAQFDLTTKSEHH